MITLAVALTTLLAAAGVPDSMVKIVVRDVSSDVPPGSFGARPKTTFRAGTCCIRVEEEKNPATGLHLLVIINEPDVWMVNQVDMTADHIVDPGPTFNAHAPILTEPGIQELELGEELAYMRARGAVREGPVKCQAGACARYTLESAGYHATLLTAGSPERPIEVRITSPAGREQVLVYDSYEAGMAFRPEFFRPPQNITVRERK